MNTDNNIAALFTFSLLTLCLIFTSDVHVSASEITKNYTIVLTSGMAEIHLDNDQGGYAHLKSLLTSLRTQKDHVIFLHGGDTLSPGILSTVDKGAHIISILNALNPSAMSISKSDLAHDEDALSLRAIEANFPLTSSNIFDPLTQGPIEGIYPHLLLDIGDLTIGLLSVIDPEVIPDYMPKRITIKNINKTVIQQATILREKGADLVVLMAGFDIDTFNHHLTTPPVDIVLLTQINGEKGLTQQGNSLYELRGHKGIVAIIDLQVVKDDSKTTWTGTSQIANLTDYIPDTNLALKINSNLNQLSTILNKVVGVTRTPIDTRREKIRKEENAFANFTADTLRELYHTDIALVNSGVFRANKKYPTGSNLTIGDIHKELPFHNRVMNLKVSGKVLKQSLENGFSRIDDAKGRFPHVSGIRVEYRPKSPPFQRVSSIQFDGKPIDPNALYTLTTIDFLAKGGDGYTELKKAKRIVKIDENRFLWEYVKNQIAAKGAISPEIDGRLKEVQP